MRWNMVLFVDAIESIQNTWGFIHINDDALLHGDRFNAEVKGHFLMICTVKGLLDIFKCELSSPLYTWRKACKWCQFIEL